VTGWRRIRADMGRSTGIAAQEQPGTADSAVLAELLGGNGRSSCHIRQQGSCSR
jgi:hypothetical protein